MPRGRRNHFHLKGYRNSSWQSCHLIWGLKGQVGNGCAAMWEMQQRDEQSDARSKENCDVFIATGVSYYLVVVKIKWRDDKAGKRKWG